MTREEIRLVASVLANSAECREWVRKVEAMSFAHTEALHWAIDETEASSPPRAALVQFASDYCGDYHDRVPANVLDRIENLVRYYQAHHYDPSVEVANE